MKFDKSKIYTTVDADEVKVGSKGYFADNIKMLISCVQEEYADTLHIFTGVSNDCDYVFSADNGYDYHLFYLVEEPREKKFRPYTNTGEMIEDFKHRFCPDCESIPLIWVKNCVNIKALIMSFRGYDVFISGAYYSMKDLLKRFTYLDGTPCGILE